MINSWKFKHLFDWLKKYSVFSIKIVIIVLLTQHTKASNMLRIKFINRCLRDSLLCPIHQRKFTQKKNNTQPHQEYVKLTTKIYISYFQSLLSRKASLAISYTYKSTFKMTHFNGFFFLSFFQCLLKRKTLTLTLSFAFRNVYE